LRKRLELAQGLMQAALLFMIVPFRFNRTIRCFGLLGICGGEPSAAPVVKLSITRHSAPQILSVSKAALLCAQVAGRGKRQSKQSQGLPSEPYKLRAASRPQLNTTARTVAGE